jgi:hypothetical protein
MTQIKFSLEDDTAEALKEYVEISGMTISGFVRRVVKSELSRRGVIAIKRAHRVVEVPRDM